MEGVGALRSSFEGAYSPEAKEHSAQIMKEGRFCGLDFGTTDSAIGVARHKECFLVDLSRSGKAMFPSAVFFDFDEDMIGYGNDAIDSYLAGHCGRIMGAPKNVLGSSLMDESTEIGDTRLSFFSIISFLIANIKERAEQIADTSLDQVVLGRPARHNDSDRELDTRAEDFMRRVARDVGFTDIHFEYETIASAITYEQQATTDERHVPHLLQSGDYRRWRMS